MDPDDLEEWMVVSPPELVFWPFPDWRSTRQPEDADENQITGYEIIQESGHEQD
jgi:hypothetical protein